MDNGREVIRKGEAHDIREIASARATSNAQSLSVFGILLAPQSRFSSSAAANEENVFAL